jgi:AraC-like DNA-binding protein
MTQIAIVVYPGYTALDFIGPHQVLRHLPHARRGLTDIARDCGLGTVETMNRSVQRIVRVTPGHYRQHFRPRTPV